MLSAGITAIAEAPEPIDAIAVTLVDLPGLSAPAVQRVCRAGHLAVATYHGSRGHPVVIPRQYWAELLSTLHGDRGARDFLQAHPEVDMVEVGDIADGTDLDVPGAPEA